MNSTEEDNVVIRFARPEDKEQIKNIRKNVYNGMDYLYHLYDELLQDSSTYPIVAEQYRKILSFMMFRVSS